MRASVRMIYFEEARRPLSSLIFLLPFILAYEIGAAFINPSAVIAYHLMELFFSLLGATGIFLPGILIVVILLVTHFISSEPWHVRMSTLLGMMAESFLWTLPLFALNRLIRYVALGDTPPARLFENIVISTGAGVYEELIFRLILVTALVILLEDLLHFRRKHALVFAVLASALLFAAHHHQPLGREPYQFGRFAFRTLAGIYLGALFLLRGYGITAGCHAVYNVMVVTLDAVLD